MGRRVVTTCPRCKARPKAVGKNGDQRAYCKECNSAYVKFRAKLKGGFWRDPDYKTVFKRKYLNIRDDHEPSETSIEAYCGWGVDRFATRAYGISHNEPNASIQLYLMGHQAVRRFWTSMNGTGWEMGPDSELFVDANYSSRAMMKGFRFGGRFPSPRKQVR